MVYWRSVLMNTFQKCSRSVEGSKCWNAVLMVWDNGGKKLLVNVWDEYRASWRGGVDCVTMRRAESICLTLSGGFSPQAPLNLHEGLLSSAPLPVLTAQMWEQTAGRQGCCGPRTSLSTLPWTHLQRLKFIPLSSHLASCAPELNTCQC